jgi:hypothetical protein
MNIPKDKTLSGKSPINLAFACNNHQLQHVLKSVLNTDDYHLQAQRLQQHPLPLRPLRTSGMWYAMELDRIGVLLIKLLGLNALAMVRI